MQGEKEQKRLVNLQKVKEKKTINFISDCSLGQTIFAQDRFLEVSTNIYMHETDNKFLLIGAIF